MYVFINIHDTYKNHKVQTASVFELGFARKMVTKLSHFKCLRGNTTLCRGQRVAYELHVRETSNKDVKI
jgi:hypothetical protein